MSMELWINKKFNWKSKVDYQRRGIFALLVLRVRARARAPIEWTRLRKTSAICNLFASCSYIRYLDKKRRRFIIISFNQGRFIYIYELHIYHCVLSSFLPYQFVRAQTVYRHTMQAPLTSLASTLYNFPESTSSVKFSSFILYPGKN